MTSVSIITICKNEVDGIRRTLESITSQTYKNLELIIIDGVSTDGTLDIIVEFQEHIAHFSSEADSGIYAAQNKGIRAATGEFLLFINAGDALFDDSVLEDEFSDTPKEDIIFGNLLIEEQDGSETLGLTPPEITLDFLLRGTLWHPVSFIRKGLFDTLGGYNEDFKIVSDYEFFVKSIIFEGVSCRHVERTIARFDTSGIGSNPRTQTLHDEERQQVQTKYFSAPVLRMFEDFEKFRVHNTLLNERVSELESKLLNEQSKGSPLSQITKRIRRLFEYRQQK